ncbi:MAG: ribosome small subunit-dependent GTPase A [Armatimonadetes bacterium]|nr:ribosome small subunit-dependent GTPase A [Armatimonadota bacterium]
MAIEGRIVRVQGNQWVVESGEERYRCHARGRLKKEAKARSMVSPVAVGDRVAFSVTGPEEGVIEEVRPRRNEIARRAAGTRPMGQTMVANLDLMVAVFAAREPPLHIRMVDRFLVVAEGANVPAALCLNKIDLADREETDALFAPYREASYPALYTSALTGEGLEELKSLLRGKLSMFCGPSGVGKSSLLNALEPGMGLQTRAISPLTGKGSHTTTHTEIHALSFGAWVADTPGIKELGMWGVGAEDIMELFPEIFPYLGQCRFATCRHTHEPGCAVKRAVQHGHIHEARYRSFVKMASEQET